MIILKESQLFLKLQHILHLNSNMIILKELRLEKRLKNFILFKFQYDNT